MFFDVGLRFGSPNSGASAGRKFSKNSVYGETSKINSWTLREKKCKKVVVLKGGIFAGKIFLKSHL